MGQQLTIYGGIFLLIAGVIGNGINILVFSTVRIYRTTPGTFYFLIGSIYNIVYIIINLTSRILSTGYGIDLTQTSTSWCKIRAYFLFTFQLITLSCSCLATIDQFFATSRSVYLRRFSNIKSAHRILTILTIVWCLYGIPVIFFYNISPSIKFCVSTNYDFNNIYIPIYVIGLLSVIPVLIMVVFGYLTHRNIHLTKVLAEQQADRQLRRMILIQTVLVVISFAPYGINYAYGVITSNVSKNANRFIIESFASTVISLVSYIYFVVCLIIVCKIIIEIIFREVSICF